MAIKKLQPKGRVAFALEFLPASLPNDVVMLFVPDKNKWNDFGYRTHADVGIRSPGGEFEWVRGYLTFSMEKSTNDFLEPLIGKRQNRFAIASEIKRPFATMLSNIKAYQRMLRLLGSDLVHVTALEAQDAAYYNNMKMDVPIWSDFLTSEPFNQSFMRLSETAFAFENVSVVLSGIPLDAEDSRQNFSADVPLGKNTIRYDFQFAEESLSPSRIAVLIGKNGAGKTESLRAISRSLVDRNGNATILILFQELIRSWFLRIRAL